MYLKQFVLILIIIGFGFGSVKSQSELDSLFKLGKDLTGEEKVHNLISISRQYMIAGDPMSITYAWQAIDLARQLDYEKGVGMAYLFLALPYDGIKNDSALKYYKRSYNILAKIDHPWTAFSLENSANIYRERGWYPEALDVSLKSLVIYEKSKDTVQMAKVLSAIGYLYSKMGEYNECIVWQNKALASLSIIQHKEIIGTAIGRLGIAYDELGIYDSAHFYNQKAIAIFREMENDFLLSQWLGNIGNTYLKQGNFNAAEEYLNEAQNHLVTGQEKTNIFINQSKVFIETGRYNKAQIVLDSALANATKYKQRKFIADVYYRNYELSKKLGNESLALDFFILHDIFEDSLLNEEKTEQIAHMKVRYDTEQKEKALLIEKAENERLAKENALAQISVYNRNKWIIGISSVGLIVIFFLLFLSQRNKRKAQAEKDAAIIGEREKGMKAIFDAQEEERKRIAKDLHDGIGQQVSAIKMFFQSLSGSFINDKPELKEDVDKISKMITDAGTDVRTISHQMMPRALTELGLVEALEDMVDKSFSKSEIECNFEHYNVTDRLPANVEIGLYRIAQELLNNIIKHSKALKVDVQLMKMQNHCLLIVQDDGKGISEDAKSDGIGMMNINNRLRSLNGEMNMESGSGVGTIATIRIALE